MQARPESTLSTPGRRDCACVTLEDLPDGNTFRHRHRIASYRPGGLLFKQFLCVPRSRQSVLRARVNGGGRMGRDPGKKPRLLGQSFADHVFRVSRLRVISNSSTLYVRNIYYTVVYKRDDLIPDRLSSVVAFLFSRLKYKRRK